MVAADDRIKDLFRAVMQDDAIAVAQFVQDGLDVLSVKNGAKMTALQVATDRGKKVVRQYLEDLAKGGKGKAAAAKPGPAAGTAVATKAAAPALADDRVKELFRAVMQDDVGEVERLANVGLEVLSVQNAAKLTALQLATERGKEAVKAFLERFAVEPRRSPSLAPVAAEAV